MNRIAIKSTLLALCLASVAAAQTQLAFKHNEGTSATETTTKVRQTLSIAGMDVATEALATATTRQTVGKRMPDGTVRMEEKTEAMAITVALPGGVKVEFDSRKPDAAKSDVPQLQGLVDTWKILSGASYTYVLDKNGKVTAVEGTQKVIDTAPPAAAAAVKDALNPDKLRKQANQGFGVLPDGAVKKGDKWSRTETVELGAGQSLTFQTFYEYQGQVEKGGKTLEKIGIFHSGVKYDVAPNEMIPFTVTGSDLKVESSSGTVLFDPALGDVVENSSTVRITGPLTLSINGLELPAKVDVTLENTTVRKP